MPIPITKTASKTTGKLMSNSGLSTRLYTAIPKLIVPATQVEKPTRHFCRCWYIPEAISTSPAKKGVSALCNISQPGTMPGRTKTPTNPNQVRRSIRNSALVFARTVSSVATTSLEPNPTTVSILTIGVTMLHLNYIVSTKACTYCPYRGASARNQGGVQFLFWEAMEDCRAIARSTGKPPGCELLNASSRA